MQRVATAPATRCSTDAFEVRTTSLSRDAVRARRFCHAVVALAASAWSAVALLNWTVNPYAQYAPHFIPPLVQTSCAEKVALLQHRDPRPTGLILGSSRVMKLEPTYLQQKTGLRFFNAGVNHGKIEDVLAFVRFYEQQYGHAADTGCGTGSERVFSEGMRRSSPACRAAVGRADPRSGRTQRPVSPLDGTAQLATDRGIPQVASTPLAAFGSASRRDGVFRCRRADRLSATRTAVGRGEL